ncbi:TetR/AcrR family transcriptional regulator [Streptomyces sp. NPDC058683]|uniref:TetR/AcrR family transcriptional regulator n=1 Tax=Streptomyces sp. NPDC058683 TaxID=3346597 RepID=UPI003662056F
MNEIAGAGGERRARSLEAAAEVFRRYGYNRTKMSDIAQSAGISRPTLYAAFSDKAAIFDAVIATMVATELATIRRHLAGQDDLKARLRYACQSWATPGFDLVRANPDARDLFDERFDAVRAGNAAFEALLTELLQEPASTAGIGVSAADLAQMISCALQGFKRLADDTAALDRMIDSLVTTTCAALALSATYPGGEDTRPRRAPNGPGTASTH